MRDYRHSGDRMTSESADLDAILNRLAAEAWRVRAAARVYSGIKVGAAAWAEDGRIFSGCNVEHRFRAHDVHAEVNALSSMVAAGGRMATAIVIAAEQERFSPCGSCMDWIFELGGPQCKVAFVGREEQPIRPWRADELMPFYPQE